MTCVDSHFSLFTLDVRQTVGLVSRDMSIRVPVFRLTGYLGSACHTVAGKVLVKIPRRTDRLFVRWG